MSKRAEGAIALTQTQRRQYDEDGFFLIENALSQSEVSDLLNLVDILYAQYRSERNLSEYEAFQMRNIVSAHEQFKALMTHDRLLPLIVDVIGYNIQLRTSHMDVRPPMRKTHAEQNLGSKESFFPWHSDGPDFGWPSTGETVPYMEMKVGYYLTDLTEHNSGAICVVRGSHATSPWIERNGKRMIDPERIVEVNVAPGTAMVWRTALWHCLTPNLSERTRRCLYFGYHHRWMRPSDVDHQKPTVLANASPIELQLLGELGTGCDNYAGDDPDVHPVSRYWRPQEEDIPLKAWSEERRARAQ